MLQNLAESMLRKIGLWDSEFTANNKLGTFIWPEKKCHYWHRFLHDETSKQIRGMWPVKCCPEVSPRRLTVGNVTKCRVSSRSRLSSFFGIQLVVGSGAVRTVIWETTGYLTECFTWGQRARRLVFNRFSVPARTVAGRIGSPVLVLCIGASAKASS